MLAETAAALRRCQLFVGADASLVHLSAALSLPSVVIFGPTNETYVRPWKIPHRVVRHDLPCAPCFEYGARPLSCHASRDFECVRSISVGDVASACQDLLRSSAIDPANPPVVA